jgi:rhamnosyltransferase
MNNTKYRVQNVYAVIVTYNHDNIFLSKMINNLTYCNVKIVFVNNSDKKINCNASDYYEIKNKFNYGLAKALNQGIQYCLAKNPKLIILFDQDSLISRSNLDLLIETSSEIFKQKKIAATGPSFIEQNTNKIHGFANYNIFQISARRSFAKITDALYLITSGTVLNPLYLNKIGLMNEKLFIDYIDVEWGFRARSLGYSLLGLNDILMLHSVGDKNFSFLFYKVPVHSSLRLYYQTRNSFYLYKRKYMPMRWKFADFIYFIKRSFLYVIIKPKNIKVIYKAIIDGIKIK